MSLFVKYNNENILTRAVIAGLLNVLNNEIRYEQVWSNDDIEEVRVPWYYNQSGDERFMQDFYTFYGDCTAPRKIDGNFDFIPRGVVTYTGSNINAQRITSRYVQGRYIREENGMLNSYVSFLYSIPLNIRFDLEMWIDRHITALKIEQELRETFYKTLTYYVLYKGLRVGCTVGFPEDYIIDKNINYSFEADNKIKLNFQVEVETYQPVFDKTTEMPAENKIKGIGYNLYPENQKDVPNEIKEIEVTSPQTGATIPKGIPLWLEWVANSKGKIINRVNVAYEIDGTNVTNEIENGVTNNEYYVWNIPNDFTGYNEPNLIWEETDTVNVARMPEIKVIPNLSTKSINENSFKLIDGGYFYTTGLNDASINIQLEMRDDQGNVLYSPDGAVYANITNNVLDLNNPITVIDPSIFFPGTVDSKRVNIHVSNANNPDTLGISGIITIV
jgi:hypothetical protein